MTKNIQELRKEQKEMACKYMEAMGIFKSTIQEFKKGNRVNYSPNGLGNFWINKEMKKEIEEIEKEYDCLVYYGINSIVDIMGDKMEFMTYLIVSKHKDDWKYDLEGIPKGYVYTYTVNRTIPEYSEFGTISYKNLYGSIKRLY